MWTKMLFLQVIRTFTSIILPFVESLNYFYFLLYSSVKLCIPISRFGIKRGGQIFVIFLVTLKSRKLFFLVL